MWVNNTRLSLARVRLSFDYFIECGDVCWRERERERERERVISSVS